jgi:hypothetical protein
MTQKESAVVTQRLRVWSWTSDYRQLTHSDIADAKRIYRHLFGSSQTSLHNFQKLQEFGVLGFGFFQDGNVGVLPQ